MRSAESQSGPSEPHLRGRVTELLRAHKQSRGLFRHLHLRLILYTHHPNGGYFMSYHKLIRLLMDKQFRLDQVR